MTKEINLINNVIGTCFGNETEEEHKEYAQHVVNAWNKILNHLAVEGYYDEDIDNENNSDKRTAMYYDNDGKNI